jgi:glycerophosphoryl diester phosphodiesterase
MPIRRLALLALLVVPLACGDDGGTSSTTSTTTTTTPATTTTVPLVEARPFGEGSALVGHRGGADGAFPDNSLDAFATARDRGADWVELDVRLSADQDVVLSHDPVTAGGLEVATSTSADLAADGIATLVEALDVIDEHRLGVNVEIKSDPTEEHYDPQRGVVDATMAVLRARPPEGPVVVSSFDRGAIDRVRELTGDDFPTALIAAGLGDAGQATADLVAAGHDGLVLNWEAATDEVLRTVLGGGLTLWSYTVDDPDEAVRLSAAGVEGIITDVPEVVGDALG